MPGQDVAIHETMGERWEFNADVADAFDEMLERSIPEYATMRSLVTDLGARFVQPGTIVVDLGCSRGEALAPLVDRFTDSLTSFVGVEVSEPMLDAARSRFADDARVRIERRDLRERYPILGRVSLTLAVLTLQFVPINYRQGIIRQAYQATIDGGAMIVVEKVLGDSAILDREMVELYHDEKGRAGYSREEIERKRLALEGVLVPLTAAWNADLLLRAGFSTVDCFWRHLNFAAWIAIR